MVDSCSICLDDILSSDHETPCRHVFHLPCLTRWLELNPTCPYCRAPCALVTKSRYIVSPLGSQRSWHRIVDSWFRWYITIGSDSISLVSRRGTREIIPIRRIHRIETTRDMITIYRIHPDTAPDVTPLVLRCAESLGLGASLGLFFLKCKEMQTMDVL